MQNPDWRFGLVWLGGLDTYILSRFLTGDVSFNLTSLNDFLREGGGGVKVAIR